MCCFLPFMICLYLTEKIERLPYLLFRKTHMTKKTPRFTNINCKKQLLLLVAIGNPNI